jgi:iron complex transport system ATP-binding protein
VKGLGAIGLDVALGGKEILAGVEFGLVPGERLGVIGPNGAGKTTLLRALAGLVSPSRGSVKIGDEPLARLTRREIARRIALVPQDTHVDFPFTVGDVVRMGRYPYLGRFTPPGESDAEAIRSAVAAVALEPFLERIIPTLSGGERQLTLIARALAQTPDFLLLDEPTANLDLGHRLQLRELLLELSATGIGIVGVMHDLEEAASLFERVILLAGGRVLAFGRPEEVITAQNLKEAFGVDVRVVVDEGGLRIVDR